MWFQTEEEAACEEKARDTRSHPFLGDALELIIDGQQHRLFFIICGDGQSEKWWNCQKFETSFIYQTIVQHETEWRQWEEDERCRGAVTASLLPWTLSPVPHSASHSTSCLLYLPLSPTTGYQGWTSTLVQISHGRQKIQLWCHSWSTWLAASQVHMTTLRLRSLVLSLSRKRSPILLSLFPLGLRGCQLSSLHWGVSICSLTTATGMREEERIYNNKY